MSKTIELLKKQGYKIVGENQHSAVKLCHFTRSSLIRNQPCYKQRFYGIESHRCAQCTPSIQCLNQCVYCWRSFRPAAKPQNFDEPKELIAQIMKAQQKIVSGFGGHPNVDRKRFWEAMEPTNFALSLVGDALLYPHLSSLLQELKRMKKSTFLMTKGMVPERIESLDAEPTNFYISLCAPDKQTFKKVDAPTIPSAWEKQMKSMELLKGFRCRKVIRITLVDGLNMRQPEKYGKIIGNSGFDFVECKGYAWMGHSRNRLTASSAPTMDDIRKFSQEISDNCGYEIKNEDVPSRVVLLSK